MPYNPTRSDVIYYNRPGETLEQTRLRLIADHLTDEERSAKARADTQAALDRWQRERDERLLETQLNEQAQAEATLRAKAFSIYMSNPAATEGGFEQQWPAIKEGFLAHQTIARLNTNPEVGRNAIENYMRQVYPLE